MSHAPSRPRFRNAAMLATAFFTLPLATLAQTDVLTWHNDVARTGQNLNEAILTPAQVNSTNFGLLGNILVDGKVDAQPLYVSALKLPQGNRNVLYIATEHDSVYAVDADTLQVYWHKNLLAGSETTSDSHSCDQVVPEIGITATPVIDKTVGPHGSMYVVALSKDTSGNYIHRVHALDLTTGAEQPGSPVVVKATYPGSGDSSSNGTVTFQPSQYKDRPALLLTGGQLYTSWGSHCDQRPYSGWLITYDKKTLAQTAALNFAPNGNEAAPWNAGAGPAADNTGHVYLSLGNGTFDSSLNAQGFPSRGDYGNSLVKVSFQGNSLNILDYWTMYNTLNESNGDIDLGSGGLMVLPDLIDAGGKTRHLAVAAGKDSNLYLADRDKLGHYNSTSNGSLYQELTGALPGGVWSSPAWFNGRIYYGSVGATMRSFELSAARLTGGIQTTSNSFNYPGTNPSISAYKSASGIVWAAENSNPAVLHAYDAADLTRQLYNSNQAANSRDHFGTGNKFIVPTIANGKVYVGTTNSVAVFGFVHQVAPAIPDGDYLLTNLKSKLVLEDPNGSGATGEDLVQWPANGLLFQKWFLSFNGRGYYTIQNVQSHQFLTDPGSSSTPGISVTQDIPGHNDSQLWSISAVSGGYVIQNKATGLVLDNATGSTQRGTAIVLSNAGSTVTQRWKIQ